MLEVSTSVLEHTGVKTFRPLVDGIVHKALRQSDRASNRPDSWPLSGTSAA